MKEYELFTIGHSTHMLSRFIELLRKYSVTAICDVRSVPYSQHTPQFNREELRQALSNYNISYVFMGKELGARSDNPNCYFRGKVQYQCLAREPDFEQGLGRLKEGIKKHRIALMCAEKDPITCHRMILISHEFRSLDICIKHILADGSIEGNPDSEKRLMKIHKIEPDIFYTQNKCIEVAYAKQAEKIAYVNEKRSKIGG